MRTIATCALAALVSACKPDAPTTSPDDTTTVTPADTSLTAEPQAPVADEQPPADEDDPLLDAEPLFGDAKAPTVRPGEGRSGLYAQPQPGGAPTKDEIRKVVRRQLGAVRRCYEEGLARVPDLQGTLSVSFMIAQDGKVGSASAEPGFPDATVAECVVAVAKSYVFEADPDRGAVVVTYPFKLVPSG